MKIDFTSPVGPKKFLHRRREEMAAMRFNRIGVERLGATLSAEISGGDLRLPLDDETFADGRSPGSVRTGSSGTRTAPSPFSTSQAGGILTS